MEHMIFAILSLVLIQICNIMDRERVVFWMLIQGI